MPRSSAAGVRRRNLTLAGGEFPAATEEASIDPVKKTREDYGDIRRVREVITDHGTLLTNS